MDVGVVYFFTDKGPDPVEFARAAEGYGFESLFVPEHTHFPASRETAYPIEFGGPELPEFYLRTYDQIVTLSMIAASTRELTLGTGVTLLAQHDPIAKAKELATLDHLSGGRVILGLAFGWNVEEAQAHGVVWKNRYSIVRDKYQVMKALWTQDTASFDGRHASLAPSFAWPKPARAGGIRTYVGGAGPMAMRQAAEWGDAWYVVPPPEDPTLEITIPKFRKVVADAGRDPDTVPVSVASAPPDPAALEKYRELVSSALSCGSNQPTPPKPGCATWRAWPECSPRSPDEGAAQNVQVPPGPDTNKRPLARWRSTLAASR